MHRIRRHGTAPVRVVSMVCCCSCNCLGVPPVAVALLLEPTEHQRTADKAGSCVKDAGRGHSG